MSKICIHLKTDDLEFYMDVFDSLADRDRLWVCLRRLMEGYDPVVNIDPANSVLEVESPHFANYERHARMHGFLLSFVDEYFRRLRGAYESWKAVAE